MRQHRAGKDNGKLNVSKRQRRQLQWTAVKERAHNKTSLVPTASSELKVVDELKAGLAEPPLEPPRSHLVLKVDTKLGTQRWQLQ